MRNIATAFAAACFCLLASCGDPDADYDASTAHGGKAMTPVDARPAAGGMSTLTDTRRTTEGGYAVGAAGAPVKLVEYGARTCPACARFSAEASAPLARYVKAGRVSYEFRDFIIHGAPDVAAALVGRCVAPSRFFPVLEATYAAQGRSLDLLSTTPDADQKRLAAMPTQKAIAWIADRAGYVGIAAANGVPAAETAKCLADGAAAQKLVDLTNGAKDVEATPTFIVNGRRLDAHDWKGVEAALKAAGA